MKAPFALLAVCLLLLGARAVLGAGCPFTAGTLGQQPVNEIDKFPADGDKWKMPKMTKPSSCSAEEYETIARELVALAEVGRGVGVWPMNLGRGEPLPRVPLGAVAGSQQFRRWHHQPHCGCRPSLILCCPSACTRTGRGQPAQAHATGLPCLRHLERRRPHWRLQ